MAEKLGLGSEVRQLKIGQSFTNPKSSAFHSIKYDFKPASVDTNKIATVDVGNNHQVTVTVPHLGKWRVRGGTCLKCAFQMAPGCPKQYSKVRNGLTKKSACSSLTESRVKLL
jgi:hypothetical protein